MEKEIKQQKSIWKKERKNVLSLDIEEGGMKMINIENQQTNEMPGEMDSKTTQR